MAKQSKSYKTEPFKKGRRTYGAIYTTETGNKVYIAYRRIKEVFRSGETTISDAVRKGTAAWAIDEETLITMRARGIKFIGVLVRETQDLFLTQTAHFWDRSKIQVLNYEHRGGALQRYMPFEHFKRRPGRLKKL